MSNIFCINCLDKYRKTKQNSIIMGKLLAVYALLICLNSCLTAFGADLAHGQPCRAEKCVKAERKREHFTILHSVVWSQPSSYVQFEHTNIENTYFQLPNQSKQTALAAENKYRTEIILASIYSFQAPEHGEHQLKMVAELEWRVCNETMNKSHMRNILSANDSCVLETKIEAHRFLAARDEFQTLSKLIVYGNMSGRHTVDDGPQGHDQLLDTSKDERIQDDTFPLSVYYAFEIDRLRFPLENKSELRNLRSDPSENVCRSELVVDNANYARLPDIRHMPEFGVENSFGYRPCLDKPKMSLTMTGRRKFAKKPPTHDYLVRFRHNFQVSVRNYILRIFENLKCGLRIISHRESVNTYSRLSALYKCLKCVWRS